MFGETQVRTGHLLFGALRTTHAAQRAVSRISRAVRARQGRSAGRRVCQNPRRLAGRSARRDRRQRGTPGEASGAMAPAAMGKQEALAKFSRRPDRARARRARSTRSSAATQEIRQVVDVLMRRRQNNPILTGEAGVGKTAVVEGFALRIVAGDVPPALKDVTLAHARCRAAASRRQHERRIREPAAAGDRGSAVLAQADHPVHRRGAHADRRRRRGRHRRCREPAEAGAGARHAAHHRRDDLGRIQEVLRERPGADAALPGGAGRRAGRGRRPS